MTEHEMPEEIVQHHIDVMTERIGVRRLAVEAGEVPDLETRAAAPDDQSTALDPAALRDAIGRKAALTALLGAVKAELATADTDVQWHIEQHAKATGGTKFDATLPNGVKVGSVSLVAGEAAAQVTDEQAFVNWLRENYKSEVAPRIVWDVQPKFRELLLAQATAAGVAQFADPESGVIHDVPGVEIRPHRSRGNRLTFSRGSKAQPLTGKELVAKAWREGRLADVLPALAPGGESE